ncbi:MAG: class I SAM-dependent DNA methyltransferase, partial [Ardenticatenaceae bacterium]
VKSVAWAEVTEAADLACGTGRTGVWLKERGVREIDGIDLTPQMLELARAKKVYRRLVIGDVFNTGFEVGRYDLIAEVLADEHLLELPPLYREAARIARVGGYFVIVGYHPHFLMSGIPTHFNRAPGEPVAIRSYVHLLSDHVKAAHRAAWSLVEMDERIVDEAWLARKPQWARFAQRPVSFLMVWRKGET